MYAYKFLLQLTLYGSKCKCLRTLRRRTRDILYKQKLVQLRRRAHHLFKCSPPSQHHSRCVWPRNKFLLINFVSMFSARCGGRASRRTRWITLATCQWRTIFFYTCPTCTQKALQIVVVANKLDKKTVLATLKKGNFFSRISIIYPALVHCIISAEQHIIHIWE